MRKIGIVGVGAIGGWIGCELAQVPGVSISAFARGETLAALRTHGLQVLRKDSHGQMQLLQAPVNASHQAAELGVQDLVVLSLKAPALREVVQQIGPMIGKDTVILSAMNGVPWWFLQGFGGAVAGQRLLSVDADGTIAQHIPAQQIVGCVVHASSSIKAPGLVQHHFGNGLIIGEPSGQKSVRVQQLLELLLAAKFKASLSDQIQKDIWYKLWGNMTVNPISALTGATTDKILDDELVRAYLSTIMLEAKAIGERIGIPIAQQPEDRHVITRNLGAFKTSMLQDVEAGKPIELDSLVSVVREIGQMVKVPTPFTDSLLGLARLQARVLGIY
jgi:2-dehydropantoate 2-reductase